MIRDFNTRLPNTTQKCYNFTLTFGRGKGKVRGNGKGKRKVKRKGNGEGNGKDKGNSKVILVHTMETYRGSGGIASLILSLGSR